MNNYIRKGTERYYMADGLTTHKTLLASMFCWEFSSNLAIVMSNVQHFNTVVIPRLDKIW